MSSDSRDAALASSVPEGIQCAVVRAYRDGRKVSGLVKQYGVSRDQFYAVLRVHGVPLRQAGTCVSAEQAASSAVDISGIPASVQDAVVNVYVGGGTVWAVADMFRLSQGAVWAILKARGVPRRATSKRKRG